MARIENEPITPKKELLEVTRNTVVMLVGGACAVRDFALLAITSRYLIP
jgi:hypothetical protein